MDTFEKRKVLLEGVKHNSIYGEIVSLEGRWIIKTQNQLELRTCNVWSINNINLIQYLSSVTTFRFGASQSAHVAAHPLQ